MHFGRNAIRLLFFAHFFYGLCAVALCMETTLQHEIGLNSIGFYALVFLTVASYYNHIYLKTIPRADWDERAAFYRRNHQWLKILHVVLIVVILLLIVYLVVYYYPRLVHLPLKDWLALLVFPFSAFAYTYKKLRRIGWLKPFLLGFIWSGVVTAYPIIFSQIETGMAASVSIWLWLKNFMFISVLCIMFDIKDLGADKRHGLQTFPVRFGIANTIQFVIIPLVALGIISFLVFTIIKGFPASRIIFNMIPYLLLLVSAYSLQKKKPLIYYFVVIDGLMIIKAICGITAAELIKY